MMIKKCNIRDFADIISRLYLDDQLDFYFQYDEKAEEYVGCSAVQKIEWLDNTLILIGGYQNEIMCCDITFLDDVEMNDSMTALVKKYFEIYSVSYVYVEINDTF